MLETILRYLKNWFVVPGGIHIGQFEIRRGRITLPFLQHGQFFRIVGSVFNDGLYQYDENLSLNDEVFYGAVWALAIPLSVLQLADEVKAWEAKNGEIAASPYQSESFGGYSYSKAANASSWKTAFAARLAELRKI